jgi:hypothetical protein
MPLTVCSKQSVHDVLDLCSSNAVDLRRYLQELLPVHNDRKKYLLLTDNFSEGNFMDFDTEIQMYCSVIQTFCRDGGVIYLKSHPGETLPRNERIQTALGSAYEIVELEKRFKRYPIELWKELVRRSSVISMSYPVLSLKYLYDIDVIQPMDHAFIERWFPKWTWRSYKNSLSLYMEPLKKLPAWDGQSVLWAGNVNT